MTPVRHWAYYTLLHVETVYHRRITRVESLSPCSPNESLALRAGAALLPAARLPRPTYELNVVSSRAVYPRSHPF